MPLSISERDLSALLVVRRLDCLAPLLSIKESTASCNIRFSLRRIISGAPKSIKCFKRLLRLMTRRYKSFKSEVAKRPPDSCTIGRRSGGITGRMVINIQSGLILAFLKPSTTRKRLMALLRRLPLVSAISSRKSSTNWSKSTSRTISSTASAPIPTRKWSMASYSISLMYSSSERILPFSRRLAISLTAL